jgi:hypothetical protein
MRRRTAAAESPVKLLRTAALLILVSLGTARADPVDDEIAYLIEFVRHSPCTFIRNGSEYDGAQAADHIKSKADYYRDKIKTVEDFIERAATRSALSGKAYEVRCNGKTIPAADWIRTEDTAYREKHLQGTD